jgi:outer membrane protein OmpA-like peptidoglycan-associated protein
MGFHARNLALFAVTLTLAAPALAQEVKTEGVIVSSNPAGYNVKTREGPLKVAVTPDTKVREVLGLRKKDRALTTLIPGLIIQFKGDQQGDTVTAQWIEFKKDDYRAAVTTRAGTSAEFADAASERAALRQAMIDGQNYVIQTETTVLFASGKTAIAEPYKQALRDLARKAPSYGNYRISVLGFADPTGNAATNEKLSQQRAVAVSNFLRQTGAIEPARVLSPSAMGEGTVAPGEAAPAGDTQARRVVVRVVTPQGQLTP